MANLKGGKKKALSWVREFPLAGATREGNSSISQKDANGRLITEHNIDNDENYIACR